MAKAAETRRKIPSVKMSENELILAAMGKAIREVRRHAKINNIKLAVGDKKSWSVTK